eukprot:CAMPEP_0180679932 /NCGR_PEP_ID=MMETSP1037_2-20121125/69192_1 /TAXON_ID=632150 /ORGANISM="Azadinium spinosum, Strain 3D9" /LENGTH=31 /DNA_ID= /DNA_START= /DNA_END= /DNA_ORIENTATION=
MHWELRHSWSSSAKAPAAVAAKAIVKAAATG